MCTAEPNAATTKQAAMSTESPSRCPFCGSPAELRKNLAGQWCVVCRKCRMRGPLRGTAQAAVEFWDALDVCKTSK